MSTLVNQLLALAERVGQEAKALREAMQSGGAVIGEIKLMGFAAVPAGWLVCNGATLPTTSYPQLYEKIGNTFGGAGATYMLPNFTNALPLQSGDYVSIGASRSDAKHVQSQIQFTLTADNMPAHTHEATLNASNDAAEFSEPNNGAYLATGASAGNAQPFLYSPDKAAGMVELNADMVTVGYAGGGQAVTVDFDAEFANTLPPVQGVNYLIYAGAAA